MSKMKKENEGKSRDGREPKRDGIAHNVCRKQGIAFHVQCGKGFRHKIVLAYNGQLCLTKHLDKGSKEAVSVLSAMGCSDQTCADILKGWADPRDYPDMPAYILDHRPADPEYAMARRLGTRWRRNFPHVKLRHQQSRSADISSVEEAVAAVQDALLCFGLLTTLRTSDSLNRIFAKYADVKDRDVMLDLYFHRSMVDGVMFDFRSISRRPHSGMPLWKVCFDCLVESIIDHWAIGIWTRFKDCSSRQAESRAAGHLAKEVTARRTRLDIEYSLPDAHVKEAPATIRIGLPCHNHALVSYVLGQLDELMSRVQELHPEARLPRESRKL